MEFSILGMIPGLENKNFLHLHQIRTFCEVSMMFFTMQENFALDHTTMLNNNMKCGNLNLQTIGAFCPIPTRMGWKLAWHLEKQCWFSMKAIACGFLSFDEEKVCYLEKPSKLTVSNSFLQLFSLNYSKRD